MQFRLNRSITPQIGARANMLSGEAVRHSFCYWQWLTEQHHAMTCMAVTKVA
jgi:hypothetical protein